MSRYVAAKMTRPVAVRSPSSRTTRRAAGGAPYTPRRSCAGRSSERGSLAPRDGGRHRRSAFGNGPPRGGRSEEHTSELQSQFHLVCRLLLEKKKKQHIVEPARQDTIKLSRSPPHTR